MGNCVGRNRVLMQNEKYKQLIREEEEAIEAGKKKSGRFRVHDEEDGNGKENHGHSEGRGERIRVVVTQRELTQIMRNKSKYSSVEQFLSEMKLKRRKISQVDGGTNGGWRPALESIPEDL